MWYNTQTMNIVILLGAPGSGKGTVAGKLAADNANLKHVSSGDLLRGAIAAGTAAGNEAKGYMDKGNLVPDALIAQMIKDVVAESEQSEQSNNRTILLDGFPRNLAQAEILEKMGAPVKSAVLIDVPDEIIQDRIAGRRTCPKCKAGYHVKNLPPKVEGVCDKCGTALTIRKDDNPETVKDRLVVYHRETEPLIKYYSEKGLLKQVDGMTGVDNVARAFLAAM